MYTAGAQHSSSRLSLWRPDRQEKLLLCVNVAGPGWASPEKRGRPAHGWKGRPRSWQRSARWYQAFFFFFAGTRRSLVPHTKTKTIFFHTKTKISRTRVHTGRWTVFFFLDVAIRNSLRSNNQNQVDDVNIGEYMVFRCTSWVPITMAMAARSSDSKKQEKLVTRVDFLFENRYILHQLQYFLFSSKKSGRLSYGSFSWYFGGTHDNQNPIWCPT